MGNFSYDDYISERTHYAKKALDEIVENATGKCKNCSSKVVVRDVIDELV